MLETDFGIFVANVVAYVENFGHLINFVQKFGHIFRKIEQFIPNISINHLEVALGQTPAF